MISFKNKKFTLLHIILFAFLACIATFFLTNFWKEKQFAEKYNAAVSSYACNYIFQQTVSLSKNLLKRKLLCKPRMQKV